MSGWDEIIPLDPNNIILRGSRRRHRTIRVLEQNEQSTVTLNLKRDHNDVMLSLVYWNHRWFDIRLENLPTQLMICENKINMMSRQRPVCTRAHGALQQKQRGACWLHHLSTILLFVARKQSFEHKAKIKHLAHLRKARSQQEAPKIFQPFQRRNL